jgi:hypothetical protein
LSRESGTDLVEQVFFYNKIIDEETTQKIKVTRQIKRTDKTVRVPKRVIERYDMLSFCDNLEDERMYGKQVYIEKKNDLQQKDAKPKSVSRGVYRPPVPKDDGKDPESQYLPPPVKGAYVPKIKLEDDKLSIKVGNLPDECTREELSDLFSRWGRVVRCVIIFSTPRRMTDTRRPLFAFIEYEDRRVAEAILKHGNINMEDYHMRLSVEKARDRKK